MSEPSDDSPSEPSDGLAVALSVLVQTPWGQKRARVQPSITSKQFVDAVLDGIGVEDPGDYRLEVPIETNDGRNTGYHQVRGTERLMDAIRGVQSELRIIETEGDS